MSVETVPIRLHSGHQHGNPEVTYTWNRGNRPENWLYVIRVFINGHVQGATIRTASAGSRTGQKARLLYYFVNV